MFGTSAILLFVQWMVGPEWTCTMSWFTATERPPVVSSLKEARLMTHKSHISLYRRLAVMVGTIAVAASALPTQAQNDHYREGHGRPAYHRDYRGGHGDYRGGGGDLGGIIAGALLGAAVAGSMRPPPAVIYREAPPPPPPGARYYYPPPGY